jgi:biopolymer transport protein ExbB
MNHRPILLGLALFLTPLLACAWWNDDWTSRKQVTVDAGITGADLQENLSEFPVLIRLHTGNFSYFTEIAENGKDIRFMADDKTPIKHYVEKIDAINEIGLIWVKAANIKGGVSSDSFWMYYGNPDAGDGSDSKGVYDVNQALVLHFSEPAGAPQDATAYGNHAVNSGAVIDPAGWIGAAARFDGAGRIDVKASPSLQINPESGWSFSSWIKIDAAQSSTTLLLAQDNASHNSIELTVNGLAATASYAGSGSPAVQTPAAALKLGKWQHIAVVARKDNLELYLDGQSVGNTGIHLASMNPALFIGGADARTNFTGLLDEVHIANKARSADWVKLLFRSQSPDFTVLNFGEDESKSSGEGPDYFVIILQSLTVDGWVVIALCGVMLVISVLVMFTKGISIARANKDNRAFLEQYRHVDVSDPGALDEEESEEDKELSGSEFLTAILGKHDHFQSSPIYHVYHAGVQELKKRFDSPTGNRPLTPEGLNVVRARLDAAVVRESQKLSKNMVLLTIAISGGPFLGLLGTVMGVMITFAVIAATGDVNINSIAPGISGALAATVAGLAVAIPALFAYNYLLTQIKDINADMQVFTDEFLAMVSDRIADRQRGA